MGKKAEIVTIGLSPAWDITCLGPEIEWGEHKVVSEVNTRPAGKALNISRALAWMGEKNTAAGLWGEQDYQQAREALEGLRKYISIGFTKVEGKTRQNITVVDTVKKREMHLRNKSELATKAALKKLRIDLQKIVTKKSVCVFAGAMPDEELLGEVVEIISCCRRWGAKIAVDTSGKALKRIVSASGVWLIKPNVEELSELVGERVRDTVASLVNAGRKMLERSEVLLISRGKKGAVVVSRDGTWYGRAVEGGGEVVSTVACGDYLLAGFLKGLKDKGDIGFALKQGIKVATSRALGWTESTGWPTAQRKILVDCHKK